MVELPDRDELVVAVIKKILPYGAFCQLPEYNNLEAFLHVSEVAPRWIKNIHEFLSEGQRYVVKVTHVDKEKNQVDVSVKRVSEEEKKQKLELAQNEKRGEKLFEVAIKASGLKADPKWKELILSEYGDLYGAFKDASLTGEKALKSLDLPDKLKDAILEVGKKNIKRAVITIHNTISLSCFGPSGVEDLKKALDIPDVTVHYLGAPRYQLSLNADDYKSGDKKMRAILERVEEFAQKKNCDFKVEEEKK